MQPPVKILIRSDMNELEFIEEKKGVYRYRYSKSKTKKGQVLEMDEPTLTKLISTNQ